MKWTRAAPLIFLISVGCTTTHNESIKTGLFKDDISKILEAYGKIDECDPNPTKKQLKDVGWDFSAPNIERVPGPPAFRRIFGENFFQGAGSDLAKMKEAPKEAEKFHAFFIPFKDIKVEKDKIYFSTQKTNRSGDDLMIIFIFEKQDCGEVLYYKDMQYVKIDSHESESAFAQGLQEFIDRYGKFGSNIKDLAERLKDWVQKNRDDE